MPEGLIESIQITAKNIGNFLNIDEKSTEITADGQRIIVQGPIKEIVEKYDTQRNLSFEQDSEQNDSWILGLNGLQTEKYFLTGILASAYNAIVQPDLDKIQICLSETITKIHDGSSLIITAMPSYLSQDKMFCVNISVNDSSPFQICHEDSDILCQVVSAGLPNVIRRMTAVGKKR
ncbi:MAG: hypothetical protein HGA36_02585 [Candidatus Moranbacteria bacterium]|nr:hypothetical protein [Candidatus Moranbacteria bacterium]